MQELEAAVREQGIAQIVSLLRAGGVEALLVKGWAIARSYPEAGLRPYSDIDLCVRAAELPAAEAALPQPGERPCPVDLHPALPKLPAHHFSLYDRSFDALMLRSRWVRLHETAIRIPGPEDHLRLLCFHMLSHGVSSPLWLCDLAVAVESRPAEFDWDYCLSGNPRYSDWVACGIALAGELLGARIEDTPVAERARQLPRWLVPAVLRAWGAGRGAHTRPRLAPFVLQNWRRPDLLREEFRLHWRSPVEASVALRAPFNEAPRLPLQLAATLMRVPRFAWRLTRLHGA
jgi:hypothetical protein